MRTKEPPQQGERRVTLSEAGAIAHPTVSLPCARNQESGHHRAADDSNAADRRPELAALHAHGGHGATGAQRGRRRANRARSDGVQHLHAAALRRGSGRLRRRRCSKSWHACRRRQCPTPNCAKPRTRCWPVCYRQLKTIEGRANLLGTYEVFQGDYNKLFTADKEIEAVTAADVQRVARKYFTAKNRTVATLVPEKPEVKQ